MGLSTHSGTTNAARPAPSRLPVFFFLVSKNHLLFYFINQCDVWSGIPVGAMHEL